VSDPAFASKEQAKQPPRAWLLTGRRVAQIALKMEATMEVPCKVYICAACNYQGDTIPRCVKPPLCHRLTTRQARSDRVSSQLGTTCHCDRHSKGDRRVRRHCRPPCSTPSPCFAAICAPHAESLCQCACLRQLG
jgi:hypothetical protein